VAGLVTVVERELVTVADVGGLKLVTVADVGGLKLVTVAEVSVLVRVVVELAGRSDLCE
jgi:hypothetical protein